MANKLWFLRELGLVIHGKSGAERICTCPFCDDEQQHFLKEFLGYCLSFDKAIQIDETIMGNCKRHIKSNKIGGWAKIKVIFILCLLVIFNENGL